MATSDDPCLIALAAEIGHAPPFSAKELAKLKSLTITHAKDLAPIEGCVGLKHLRLVACELEDLMALSEWESLNHLEIHCSRIDDVLGVPARTLTQIDVLFSSVNDVTYLLGAKLGWQGTLVGNPWSDTSRGALTEQLDNGDITVDIGSKADWQECRDLWKRLEACSGELAGDSGLIVRPGLPKLTKNTYDGIVVDTGAARSALNEDEVTIEGLFKEYEALIGAPDLAELAASRELGRTDEATEWIAKSALPAPDKKALKSFVSRFPKMVFYRVTKDANDRKERLFELKFPKWYRTMRETLDGWWPLGMCPPVQFDEFEDSSPRGDRLSSLSYHLGLRFHGDDEKEAMLKAKFVVVGYSKEAPFSALAIRLDDDPTVYEFSPEDISDLLSEGGDVKKSMYPVFRSYAAMLGHVKSIHLPTKVVDAKD